MVIFAPILVYCIIKMIKCPLLFSYKEKKTIDKIILLMKGSLLELFVSTKILCKD